MSNSNNDASPEAALAKAVAGCLWGTAVGDALGLPCEGLTPGRIRALFGGVPDSHRLVIGRGMISDDTEHTLLVYTALAESAGDGEAFTRHLSRGLRRWVLALPAGVGLATLRAGLRLAVGVPASRSGVYSAGNGPAMRSALIGVACAWDADGTRLRDRISRSSRLTHTDPRAEYGARAVAICAASFARGETGTGVVSDAIQDALPEPDTAELLCLLHDVRESVSRGEITTAFAAARYPRGVSGYVLQTVPVAIHAALSHPADFRKAVSTAIACGGDTDTVAAITGGIVGASVGVAGIPEALRRGIWEPTGVLAEVGAERFAADWTAGRARVVPAVWYPFVLLRNTVFAVIVIAHGLRRLLPPYGQGDV